MKTRLIYAGTMVGMFFVAIALLNYEPESQRSSPLTKVKLLDAARERRHPTQPVVRQVAPKAAPKVEQVPGKYEYRGRYYDIDPDTLTHWFNGRRVMNVEVIPGSSHFDITKVKRGMIGYEPDRPGLSTSDSLYDQVMHYGAELTHEAAMIIAESCV